MSIITLSPEMRQLIAGGELWDAETPNSAYRGRINNSRLFLQTGTPTLTTGKVGSAYTFPGGTNSYLSIARDNALWLSNSGTLAFWWHIDFSNGWAASNLVLAFTWSGNTQVLLRRSTAGSLTFRNQTTSGGVVGYGTPNSSLPAVTDWYHIVLQWAVGVPPVAWINGVKYTMTGGLFQGFDALVMAANATIGSTGMGCEQRVEQLMVLPGKTLSDTDVLHLYNSGQGRAWRVHRAIPEDFLSTQIG